MAIIIPIKMVNKNTKGIISKTNKSWFNGLSFEKKSEIIPKIIFKGYQEFFGIQMNSICITNYSI